MEEFAQEVSTEAFEPFGKLVWTGCIVLRLNSPTTSTQVSAREANQFAGVLAKLARKVWDDH
jgi:hypothetical protein